MNSYIDIYINICIYFPNERSEEGFLLVLYRIAPVFQDFPSSPSSPTCLDLPRLA